MKQIEICLALAAVVCFIIAGIINGGLSVFQGIMLLLDGIIIGVNLPH